MERGEIMQDILLIILLVILNLSMLVFLIYNIYELIMANKFYKRMVKQHEEFMKSLEKE